MSTENVHARFWVKVAPAGPLECWLWTASRNQDGYGNFWASGVCVKAHRWAYEALRSAIPHGLQLDHLCRNRACVNPWHLEPVTNRENHIRGLVPLDTDEYSTLRTRCRNGHEYTPENTRVSTRVLSTGTKTEGRRCRACDAARARRSYHRRAAAS